MLIYHFGSRDALVSAVVARSGERSSAALHDLEPARGVRAGVRRLWVAYQEEPLRSCTSIYLQASATGLIGREPYLSDVRASNEEWTRALSDYLSAAVRRRDASAGSSPWSTRRCSGSFSTCSPTPPRSSRAGSTTWREPPRRWRTETADRRRAGRR